MRRRQAEIPFRNHTAAAAPKPARVRVPVPAPQFASPAEVKAYQAAVASVVREDGESLLGWLTRVAAQAERLKGGGA